GGRTRPGSVACLRFVLQARRNVGPLPYTTLFRSTAGTLAANGANVYVSNSGALTLNDVTGSTAIGTVTNGATTNYEVTDNNTITVTASPSGNTPPSLNATPRHITGAGSVSATSLA